MRVGVMRMVRVGLIQREGGWIMLVAFIDVRSMMTPRPPITTTMPAQIIPIISMRVRRPLMRRHPINRVRRRQRARRP